MTCLAITAKQYIRIGKTSEFQFYTVLWFILPFTDGAAVVYELITKPYIVPVIAPIAKACEGWLTTLALTIINASHMVREVDIVIGTHF